MKGDFSRITFDRTKHYSAAYPQQGRVITDADMIEEHDIQQYRSETTASDAIGPSGTPKLDPGFTLAASGETLTIGRGRYYIDGLLFENESQVAYDTQPYLPELNAEEHIKAMLTAANRRLGLVYLDGFRRVRTTLDEPGMRESALAGPDTSVRMQAVWQVKMLPLNVSLTAPVLSTLSTLVQQVRTLQTQLDATTDAAQKKALQAQLDQRRREIEDQAALDGLRCDAPFTEWTNLLAPRHSTLIVDTPAAGGDDDPCTMPPGGGYMGGENQLYRVEIHKAGSTGQRTEATFKWSRENGSVTARIEAVGTQNTGTVSTSEVRVNSTGRDSFLGIETGYWVEYADDATELKGLPGTLVQVESADNNIVKLKGSISVNFSQHPKLRRWDQSGTPATANGLAMNTADGAFVALESEPKPNIRVSFGNGVYRPGDYWVFPARAGTGKVEFPSGPQSPAGVKHHHARLGIVFLDNANALHLLLDCRELFPPFTDITAEDVRYDNTACPDLAQAKTVQQALDTLCRNHKGSCTFAPFPGEGWEAVFDAIGEKQDAHICFQVGEYPLRQTAVIRAKGNLKLTGCGPGSRIIAPAAEAALRFENCGTVIVRDLFAETGSLGEGRGTPMKNLNGTFSFHDCAAVEVEHVTLKCASGVKRAATCLTVKNSTARPVRIIHCDMQVGHQQTGILLVNVSRAQVEDNVIGAYPIPEELTFGKMLENTDLRANVRRIFISGAILGDNIPPARKGSTNVRLASGNHVIHFKSQIASDSAWTALLNANPPQGIRSARGLLTHVVKLVDRLLVDSNLRNRAIPFKTLFDVLAGLSAEERAAASQGITIAGLAAHEVRILNNSIVRACQGVHIGLSAQGARDVHAQAGAVTIGGNMVSVVLSPEVGKRERHGIFVGNCTSLLIENNEITLKRLPQADGLVIDGIRIWGVLGNRMLVAYNHLHSADGNQRRSFDFGIHVNPLANSKPAAAQWLVMYNVAPSKQSTVRLLHAQQVPNTNVP